MRAKVALLRHEQGDPEAADRARQLLDLAERHLTAGQVRLVLVGGLPGTGKSTLARGIGQALGWRVLRTDEIREDVVPRREQPGGAAYGAGRYAPAAVEAAYAALFERARPLLATGETVVLDGSWTSAARRAEAAVLARQTHAAPVPLRCAAPAEVAAARIDARRRRGGDPSEATPEVAAAMAAGEDPWPEASTVDTSGDEASSLRAALEALGTAATPPAG
jgi:predicted kinase